MIMGFTSMTKILAPSLNSNTLILMIVGTMLMLTESFSKEHTLLMVLRFTLISQMVSKSKDSLSLNQDI